MSLPRLTIYLCLYFASFALCDGGHRWEFEPEDGALEMIGRVVPVDGPDASVSRTLPAENRALRFSGDGDHIRIPDETELRFDNGDEITIECWLRCESKDSNPYIVGKGRLTTTEENQNWALRLMKVGGSYRLSFLFRSRAEVGVGEAFHRWNSNASVPVGKTWHHVAVSYRFGEPRSIKGFIDGEKSGGRWDLGGATERAPVVDAADVWIGSARGGAAQNSFIGAVDSLAIHRSILTDEELAARVDFAPALPPVDWNALPSDVVGVEVFSGLPSHAWPRRGELTRETLTVPSMALMDLPPVYGEGGNRERRRATLVRMAARVELLEGDHQLLVRAPSLARLRIDGEQVLNLPAYDLSGDAHQNMRPPADPTSYPRARLGTRDALVSFNSSGRAHEIVMEAVVGRDSKRFTLGEMLVAVERSNWKLLAPGEPEGIDFSPEGIELYRQQQMAEFAKIARVRRQKAREEAKVAWERRHATARSYIESLPELGSDLPADTKAIDHFLMAKMGAKAVANQGSTENRHDDIAGTSLTLLEKHCVRCHGKKSKGELRLQTRKDALKAGESGLLAIVPGNPSKSEVMRRLTTADDDEQMPPKGDGLTSHEIETLQQWITAGAPWPQQGGSDVVVPPVLGDEAFLRRLYLDTVGVFPGAQEIRSFVEDQSTDRVERRVEALLRDPRNADYWTSYWQDVLAENPRLVKGKLNNTGPFRWWIHEALLDKLPFDQFVRELIAFGGSDYEGGAAGFGVATENDSPAAAKAHVIATAFLGTEMKCARCHDSPYHETKQEDLFSLAAMLEGKPISVPDSSTVPASFFSRLGERKSLVEVTLKPGVPVDPDWPFANYVAGRKVAKGTPQERLAEELTRPENQRFAQVIVNRVWKRYFGQGFVEPVSDWEGNAASHPELLDFLARDFVAHGYSMDRLSKLILTSDAYRRQARLHPEPIAQNRMFEAPLKRRLTAEQLVDSLFSAAGVPVYSEELTFDVPGTNKAETFQNLGYPTRAWQFVSLASDRDRPSLTLPHADSIVSVLKAFGWRADRAEPVTVRDAEASVLQPGMLANGVFGAWISRLSPFSQLTLLAARARTPEELANELYLRFLSRLPSESERAIVLPLLTNGFEERLLQPVDSVKTRVFAPYVREVTWTNHLSPEANSYAAETESRARLGPPVSDAIAPAWRTAMEDVVWAIINSPEMQFIP